MMIMLLAAALARGTSQAAGQPAAPAPALICREHQKATGTRIRSSRRCKTAEQWQIEDAERERMPTTMRIGDRKDVSARTPQ